MLYRVNGILSSNICNTFRQNDIAAEQGMALKCNGIFTDIKDLLVDTLRATLMKRAYGIRNQHHAPVDGIKCYATSSGGVSGAYV